MRKFSAKLNKAFKLAFACIFAIFIALVLAVNLLFPLKFSDSVAEFSNEFKVDKALVYSVIWTESKFNSDAVSKAGAVGLMQLMPSTAKWCCDKLGENYDYQKLFDSDFNIKLGTYYLSYLIDKYGQKDAITAYNAGEGNLLEWKGEVKFSETQQYIKRVNLVKKVYTFKLK